MKIGLVCPYDMGAPGGVQQLVGELAGQLRERGDDVVVVGAGEGTGADGHNVGAGPSVSVPGNQSRVPLTLWPAAWQRVRRSLADVEVVNVHEPFIPLVGWAALALDKPMVATFHADAPLWAETLYRWAPLVGRRLRRSQMTAVSEVAARVIPTAWGDVTIIPNAIDVASYHLPIERADNRVAFLGRDEPRKGLDVLLRAWPGILERHPQAELVVMGADRGVPPPAVTYLGPVSGGEKRKVLASSQVLVAPNTRGESFGIVLAEAMAAGCAVVASDLPSFQSVMGDAGRPFPVGNAAALTQEVVALLGDEGSARNLSEVARERAWRFDWGEVAPAYRSVYEKALR